MKTGMAPLDQPGEVRDKGREGIVFNIQRFSLQDGPGIRTTVFLKGCPLRCAWCSNPESQELLPELLYRSQNCQKCRTCADVCKTGAIVFADETPVFDRALCNRCEDCVHACIGGALEMTGKWMTVEEVACVKGLGTGRVTCGSTGVPLAKTDTPLTRCSPTSSTYPFPAVTQPADPVEMDTVVVGGLVTTIKVEKEIFYCADQTATP